MKKIKERNPRTQIGGLIIFVGLLNMLLNVSCNSNENIKAQDNLKDSTINFVPSFKPNVVWIVAEDLSPYIPSFGDSTVVTPSLSKLAASGVCYDNFFTPHPVCSPARASIITGMYANHIGASHMRTGPWGSGIPNSKALETYAKRLPEGVIPYEAVPKPGVKMFTEYLRAAGYYCTNNAKQDYQFLKTMTAWDESGTKAHWKNRPKGKPFFAVFNMGVTHESGIWKKAKDSLWVPEDLEVPVPPYLPDTEVGRRDIRRMYSNILEMDTKVGKLINELEAAGLMDETIIMWYTDHGGPLPRQKRLLYDSGLKVPMIICFPKEQFSKMRDNRMISFIDLAPTVLSLVGIQPKDYMDGKAFLGEHIRKIEPKYVFGAADRFDEVYDKNRSVRNKRFKYIRYYSPEKPMFLDVAYRRQMPIMQELLRLRDQGELNEVQSLWFRPYKPEEELFDIVNDPHEIHNVANDPVYTDVLIELRAANDEWVNHNNETGMMDERDLLEQLWPGKIQPTTKDPTLNKQEALVEISCETEGASIGYKIIAEHDNPENMSWTVYDGPIKVPVKSKLITVADRIGYKRSQEIIKLF